jgi:hypothetical protein
VVYVDNCLFFGPSDEHIEAIFEKMRSPEVGLDSNIEDNVAWFLGVLMTPKDDDTMELTQTGLLDQIIMGMGLDDANHTKRPTEYGALGMDLDGMDSQEKCSYRSVLGMMLYLCNTRANIQFATSQCARFTSNPKYSHNVALKRIGRYLIGTCDHGLILKPDHDLGIKMFVDADFAGMHGYKDPEDPTSVQSCTGFVICIAKCPVLWVSRLQTETAFSTMHAEYIALSTAMRDLLLFKGWPKKFVGTWDCRMRNLQ